MPFLELLAIAIGLSMDAFAAAVVSGYAVKRLPWSYALKIAACFGLAQMLMPIFGWAGGVALHGCLAAFDHWLAFLVLSGIGVKMIYEAIKIKTVEEKPPEQMGWTILLGLSVATSIDALAVGFSIALLKVRIIIPATMIGAVTFSIALIGVFLGNRFGHFCESKVEIAGGLILIAIGGKILLEHLL